MPWVNTSPPFIVWDICAPAFLTAVRPFGSVTSGAVSEQLSARLFELSPDGLKTVLGALLGSLSLAAEATWRERSLNKNK
jgi:hypothetical protein